MDKIDYYIDKFSKEGRDSYLFRRYEFKFSNLYRGRPFGKNSLEEVKKELYHVDKMWSPPPSCKVAKGRCNRENESVLYLSSYISSIPKELGAEENDLIAVAKYKMKDVIKNISLLGFDEIYKNAESDFKKIIENHYKDIPFKAILLDNKYSMDFIKKRDSNLKYDIYDKTIALTELSFLKSTCLIYPSVAVGYKSFNLVLKPEEVKSILKPVGINICLIVGENFDDRANLKSLSYAEIDDFGCVKWIDKEEDFCFYK